ncbi:Dehydroquinate synthase-like protein [Amniculicola lignicola CBS 123094]|uniref:Dehydroquinate synthase-like protein n=1 Tax=Amniculicola lignicola CBS 123094 TaxID=1392246 RepID=A0A6A5WU17_9PLEO|nr:Dehydroquinate synthase-like protein [Amniculicola lignicola CBS 123094]
MDTSKQSPTTGHRIQQLDIPSRQGHDAIFNAEYLTDIPAALGSWNCERIVLVHSTALDAATTVIGALKSTLGGSLVGTKSGVGAHSPYPDAIDIAQLLHSRQADCLISVGSSSYSDACKTARLLHSTLPSTITVDNVENTVDQKRGLADNFKDPLVKLILVPTSLSASEWNHVSSGTNPNTGKKQHFGIETAAPDLVLLDPELASTAPRKLWLSSGMRAVDHCVETICNPNCNDEAATHMEETLAILLKGLTEYKEGEKVGGRAELLKGISECQVGSRQAMVGLLQWKIPMGPSHAIGHQLGSTFGVMHGVTSCVMLASVMRYMKDVKKDIEHANAQNKVLAVYNRTLDWDETSAADAIERFVRFLELPSSLKEVGLTEQKDLDQIAEKTMTDVWGGGKKGATKQEVLDMLELARGC